MALKNSQVEQEMADSRGIGQCGEGEASNEKNRFSRIPYTLWQPIPALEKERVLGEQFQNEPFFRLLRDIPQSFNFLLLLSLGYFT